MWGRRNMSLGRKRSRYKRAAAYRYSGGEVRRGSKRLAEHPSQLRAEAARTHKGDWHIASLSRNRLHCSPGLGWAEVGTQFFQQFGKFISGLVQIPSQRSHGLEVATGSSPQAEIDSSGKHRFQCSELFCHYQRGMVGQHDAAAAHANRFRSGRNMADQHSRCRARQPFDRVMFRQPVAGVAQALYVLG